MNSLGKSIKFITLASASMFVLNMIIMYVFFNTNVFNPVRREEPDISGLSINLANNPASEAVGGVNPEDNGFVPEEQIQEAGNDLDVQDETGSIDVDEAMAADTGYFMTTGEIGFLENLGLMDKLEAISLISKVGREETDKIYDMVIDGVTYQEMEYIKAVLAKYLDTDEIQALTELIDKNKEKYSISNN